MMHNGAIRYRKSIARIAFSRRTEASINSHYYVVAQRTFRIKSQEGFVIVRDLRNFSRNKASKIKGTVPESKVRDYYFRES